MAGLCPRCWLKLSDEQRHELLHPGKSHPAAPPQIIYMPSMTRGRVFIISLLTWTAATIVRDVVLALLQWANH